MVGCDHGQLKHLFLIYQINKKIRGNNNKRTKILKEKDHGQFLPTDHGHLRQWSVLNMVVMTMVS